MFAKALGDRHSFSKQHLFVLAEDLVLEELRTARAHHPGRQHHNVLLIRIRARQRPFQREGIDRVAHRHQHAA